MSRSSSAACATPAASTASGPAGQPTKRSTSWVRSHPEGRPGHILEDFGFITGYNPISAMRIAYFSPLPPMKSGIADYSAELLPELAGHCEVELIVDEGLRPDPGLAGRFPVHGHRALPGLLERGRFDAVVYHLGNNRDYHASIYRSLLEHPGILVLHELVIHHLVRDLTLYAGD